MADPTTLDLTPLFNDIENGDAPERDIDDLAELLRRAAAGECGP